MADGRTIVFFPEGAYGPTNNCAGIGSVLRARGHRVVFIVEESFAGSLEAKGFEERLMRLGPPPAEPEVPGQFWIDFIRDTAPVFRKPTIEQLGEFIAPTFQALIDGAQVRPPAPRRRSSASSQPDAIVEDNVVSFPAIMAARPPVGPPPLLQPGGDQGPARRAVLVRLPGRGPDAPGRPSSTRSGGPTATCGRTSTPSAGTTARAAWRGADNGPDFMHESPYLNLYSYPRRGRLRAGRTRSARRGTSSTRRSAPPDDDVGAAGAPCRAGRAR